MGLSIQARLDEQSEKALKSLVGKLGWSPSKVVREGLRLLAACHLGNRQRRVIGLGEFSSGKSDLGSNKAHLKGFGR
jgi:hypothetical protein